MLGTGSAWQWLPQHHAPVRLKTSDERVFEMALTERFLSESRKSSPTFRGMTSGTCATCNLNHRKKRIHCKGRVQNTIRKTTACLRVDQGKKLDSEKYERNLDLRVRLQMVVDDRSWGGVSVVVFRILECVLFGISSCKK